MHMSCTHMRGGAGWTAARHRRRHTAGRDGSMSRGNVWRVSGVKKRQSQGNGSMQRVSARRARMSADRGGDQGSVCRGSSSAQEFTRAGRVSSQGKKGRAYEGAPAASRTMAQISGSQRVVVTLIISQLGVCVGVIRRGSDNDAVTCVSRYSLPYYWVDCAVLCGIINIIATDEDTRRNATSVQARYCTHNPSPARTVLLCSITQWPTIGTGAKLSQDIGGTIRSTR